MCITIAANYSFRGEQKVSRVVGESAFDKKVRFNHGNLSYHPVKRVESAKGSYRPTLPANSSLFDLKYQNTGPSGLEPSEMRTRDQNSHIDVGGIQERIYNSKPSDEPYKDRTNDDLRRADHNFSGIFQLKHSYEALSGGLRAKVGYSSGNNAR